MVEFDFLKSLVILFGLSAVVVFILGKFRIPSIIGFLLAGVLLGPYGLELIKDIHMVEIFAEIGIVLLLFTIGLEISLKNILSMRKSIFVGGILQIAVTVGVVVFIARALGMDANGSIILGGLVSLSSTAIIMKLLFDRAELDSPHGRVSMGVLIIQDLSVVFFIMLVPLLSDARQGLDDILIALVKSLAFIVTVVVVARWLIPRVLHQIVHTRIRELFVISIIFLCLGAAYVTYLFGFSLALGAFIAGLIVSESEYAYQAVSDIHPFKDSFNGLFFISVGMLMDVNFFGMNIHIITLIVIAIIAMKALLTALAIRVTGNNLRVSLHSAVILSQIGEFAFVIAVASVKAGIISDIMYQFFLSSAIVTMVLTPLLIQYSSSFSIRMTSMKSLRRLQAGRKDKESDRPQKSITDHVIIVGFGINGRNLARVLKELEVPYMVLEMNSETVLKMKKEGEPIYYGDATSIDILRKMSVASSRVVVVSINDPSATRKIVFTVRQMNKKVFIVVRTRFIAEVDDLLVTGADEVIPEEFETSIELFSRILQYYQMPKSLINRYADKFRKDHYQVFIKGETPKRLFEETLALMPDMDYESYVVEHGCPAVDSTPRRLNIQKITGAYVVAVRRKNDNMRGISPDFEFNAGDIIFLIGAQPSLKKAYGQFFRKTAGGPDLSAKKKSSTE